jgi:signal transduction histidine kinase
MCGSLAAMLSGILLYMAKKGGISRELQQFFFINLELKARIQYYLITLDSIGYAIAIGRSLFPLFLLVLAIHYSMIPWLQRNRWLKNVIYLFPILSLIIYHPTVFQWVNQINENLQQVIVNGTTIWIVVYLFISISLFIYEAYSIEMKVIQRNFIFITAFLLSLSLLYILYFGQEPAQVYQLYSYENGIYYMNSVLSIPTYILIVVFNVIFAIIGFTSLLKYTHEIFQTNKEEITIQRKFEAISTGTSLFVHSIKNQLLANRVIFKRINHQMVEPVELEELKVHIDLLAKQNENILLRIEELYRAVKTNTVHLVPVDLSTIFQSSLDRFQQKYPGKRIKVNCSVGIQVLADNLHLSEAIYNLLTNAHEALNEVSVQTEGEVLLSGYHTRQYTVIEVKDNGIGINKKELKKICEPFFTKKNSNHNWGMGLHYVKMIVKEHFGILRYESKENHGSKFYLLLPKYRE